MSRLMSLLFFAALLVCGLAQGNDSNETTTTEPENNSTTTTEVPLTTTQAPPAPSAPVYKVNDSSGICLKLQANMTMNITYEITSDNGTTENKLEQIDLNTRGSYSVDNSTCGDTTSTVGVAFDLIVDTVSPQFIVFTFTKDKNAWKADNVLYSFLNNTLPDGGTDGQYKFSARKLFDTNLNIGSSYKCINNPDFTFNTSTADYKINATLRVLDLQVQAFYDTSKVTDGTFGSVQDCAASKGNKIVPIAVGAALAGLVIVVLIAYLIGRLKSRRQNSYEALS